MSRFLSMRSYVNFVIRSYSNTGQIGLERICRIFPISGWSGVFWPGSVFYAFRRSLLCTLYIFQAEKYFFGSFTEPIAHTGSGNKNPHKSQFDSKWARKYFTCFIIHPPCTFCNVWSSSSSLKTCGKLASELRGWRFKKDKFVAYQNGSIMIITTTTTSWSSSWWWLSSSRSSSTPWDNAGASVDRTTRPTISFWRKRAI